MVILLIFASLGTVAIIMSVLIVAPGTVYLQLLAVCLLLNCHCLYALATAAGPVCLHHTALHPSSSSVRADAALAAR